MLKDETKIIVRYAETDQMGIVHHSNYAKYFEIGRTNWLHAIGISYKNVEKSGIILPVVSLECNFKKPAYYDDKLTIITTIKKQPTVKIEFNYSILNQQKEIICTGNTILAFVNKENMRPIRCPDYFIEAINN